MSLAMRKPEREAFLAETRVGIVSIPEAGRGPLTVPVWYAYEPGGAILFVTGEASRKTALIRRAGRLSLCVQTETPPYKYVSVEGKAAIAGPPDFERHVRAMALRYLGPDVGEMYLAITAAEREQMPSVLVRVTPERWLSVDYTKMI